MIVGGYTTTEDESSNRIYYGISRNISKNSIHTIWKTSTRTTLCGLSHCRCVIINQNTSNPTLLVIGGWGAQYVTKQKFALKRLMDSDSYFQFTFNFEQVIKKCNFGVFYLFPFFIVFCKKICRRIHTK